MDSIMLDPTFRSGSVTRAANHSERIEGEIRMLDCEKSSGVKTRKKSCFFAPRPPNGFRSFRLAITKKSLLFFATRPPNGFRSFRLAVATGVLFKSSSDLQDTTQWLI